MIDALHESVCLTVCAHLILCQVCTRLGDLAITNITILIRIFFHYQLVCKSIWC